jgi:release factor glutamine methyltransferase
MTLGEAQQGSEARLRQAGIESARLDTLILLEKVTGKARGWLMAHPEEELSDPAWQEFSELINRRAQRNPLVHLTHTREFYGLDFYIDAHVLTPRVETEKMVDYAIKYARPDSRLIDIGTGSGALAIAIKKHRPDLEVWASDLSETELAVARRNAATHDVDIRFVVSDLFEAVDSRFTTVVTNLPYLRDDADLMPEVQKEPAGALFGGTDGLELYRRFLKQLPKHLEPGGFLFAECDPWQHEALIAEAAKMSLRPTEKHDYFILGFHFLP